MDNYLSREANHHPAQDLQINKPRVFWAAIVFTFVALTSFVFALFLIGKTPIWQIYAITAITAAALAADIMGTLLIARGRTMAGLRYLYWSLLFTVPPTTWLVTNTTPFLIAIVLLVGFIHVFYLQPRAWRRSYQFGPIIAAVLMAIVEIFKPTFRANLISQTAMSGYWGPIILVFLLASLAFLIVREAWSSNIRVKLLASTVGTSVLAVSIFGTFVLYRNQQSQKTWSTDLQNAVQKQSRQEITSTVQFEADMADVTLSKVTYAVQQLADYQASLFTNESYFGQGGYWDGNSKLIQHSEGQYANTNSDPAAVYIPNTITLSPSLVSDLNTSLYLDFSAPTMLKENPNMVAVYYTSARNYSVYYPNVDLTSLVPADFDLTVQSFYSVAIPENNPERKPVWTKPYQDPAGTGLIVTNSVPVYDQNNRFRGVMSADVQLSKLSDEVSTMKLGKTGFAFLIDPDGHIIAMPEGGYQFFGIQPEVVPVGETPKVTIFGSGSADFQNVTQKMVKGASGMETITFQGAGYYLAYSPVPVIGYSLGLIAPSVELDQAYVETRQQIENTARNDLFLFLTILLVVIFAAIAVGIFMSQSISKPLIHLTHVAAEVSKGSLSAKANIQTNDEIGTLASVFNNMTSQLQETLQGLEQRVAARTRDLEIAAEVGTATATILESKRLLQEVVDLTKQRFNLYHSHIYLLDEAGKNLVLTAGAGEPGRIMVAEGRSIPLEREQSLVARSARERKGITVNDVTHVPDFLPNPLLPDTRSELAVPMVIGGHVIGVFDIQSEQVGRFTDADVNIQTTLAAQLATSIQNVRSFEQSRKQAEFESVVNVIGQKIQHASTVEETLKTAIRELGIALGAPWVRADLDLNQPDDNGGI